MAGFRVLVTAGRNRRDERTVWDDLTALLRDHGKLTVVHGACSTGGDAFAARWCATAYRAGKAVEEVPYPAELFGAWPSCGPKRNKHMVSLGADEVLAYPDHSDVGRGSPGTYGCIGLAVKRGLSVRIRRLPDDPPKGVQRQRTEGWRKPPAAVIVDRTTPWGNPFTVADALAGGYGGEPAARGACVLEYRRWLDGDSTLSDRYAVGGHVFDRRWVLNHLHLLRGRDLCCPCSTPEPGEPDWCHRATLLTLANPTPAAVGGLL